jgi:hypothetical protein
METIELTAKDFFAVKGLECEQCYFHHLKCLQGECKLVDELHEIYGICTQYDHVYKLKIT